MDFKQLSGYKTYIMTVATICYALGGWIAGFVKPELAIPIILGALGLSALRNGLPKQEKFAVPETTTNPS